MIDVIILKRILPYPIFHILSPFTAINLIQHIERPLPTASILLPLPIIGVTVPVGKLPIAVLHIVMPIPCVALAGGGVKVTLALSEVVDPLAVVLGRVGVDVEAKTRFTAV
jgi:hypothetical protein